MENKVFLLFCFVLYYNTVEAIKFTLHPNTQKCLKEDIQAHQLVKGEFEVSEAPGQTVDYIVNKINYSH